MLDSSVKLVGFNVPQSTWMGSVRWLSDYLLCVCLGIGSPTNTPARPPNGNLRQKINKWKGRKRTRRSTWVGQGRALLLVSDAMTSLKFSEKGAPRRHSKPSYQWDLKDELWRHYSSFELLSKRSLREEPELADWLVGVTSLIFFDSGKMTKIARLARARLPFTLHDLNMEYVLPLT